VHPDAIAVLATNSLDTPVIGLLGRDNALQWNAASLEARRAQASRGPQPGQLQLDDAWAVVGGIVADAHALRRFSAKVQPNRDDMPVVAYRAPRLRDAPGNGPRERLRELLEVLDADPRACSARRTLPPRRRGSAGSLPTGARATTP
jgi:spermidine synthase